MGCGLQSLSRLPGLLFSQRLRRHLEMIADLHHYHCTLYWPCVMGVSQSHADYVVCRYIRNVCQVLM